MTTLQDAVASNLIDQDVHGPLLRDMDRILSNANVPAGHLFTSMASYCTAEEIDYVRAIRRQTALNIYGLLYVGETPTLPVTDRMLAIAAACLRNYLSAKVMVLQEVLAALRADDMPSPTVLLIPNFYIGQHQGQKVPDWHVSNLLGLLYARQANGQQTVLYVQNVDRLAAVFSPALKIHLETHFKRLAA
jgi:hypothetical protein